MDPNRSTKERKSIQELISQRLQSNAAHDRQRERMERVPRDRPVRASFAQERLWYFQQFQPNDTSYNTRFAFHVKGPLNEFALRQTLNELVKRHEALRTTIVEIEGEAYQKINDPYSIPLHTKDFSGFFSEERVKQYVEQTVNKPFDLEAGPLFEAHLIRIDSGHHILLFHMHHIVFDGWSVGIFMNDLKNLYESYCRKQRHTLEPLAYQYADFSAWQRKTLTDEQIDKHLQYWLTKLDGAPQTIELPYDKARSPVQSSRGNLLKLVLAADCAEKVREFSRQEGTTLFITMLTAFYILLYKYTKQSDLLIGSPIAARTSKELESIIGFFVNMICLRGTVREEATFRDLVREVKNVCLEAYTHQDLPFEKLVEKLQPERDLSRSPLFQVMFEVQHGSHTVSIEGLEIESMEDSSVTSKYDLSLIVEDIEDGSLVLNFEYCTDLFEDETIKRFGSNFIHFVKTIVSQPDQKVSESDIICESEKRTLLVEWTDTSKEFASKQDYYTLFRKQALQTPDNIAAQDDNGHYTYAQLLHFADRISLHLRQSGVGLEDVVGLLGKRDFSYLASIIAILQCGAVYVPLDPGYPEQRIRYILQQSKCKLLLQTGTLESESDTWTAQADGSLAHRVLRLEDVRSAEPCEEEKRAAAPIISPMNAAYTIFTSGSTGLPKGSMVEHQGLMNHLFSKIDDFRLTARDTIAQTASQCFDISVWQFLAILLVGGKVRIYREETVHDPALLLELAERDAVTVMEATPAYLKVLLQAAKDCGSSNKALKHMLVTGEQADSKLLKDWLDAFPATTIVNAYGPSECSDDVTLYHVRDATVLPPGLAPIGKAISNMRVYILDDSLQLLPIGAKGEIYIGGVGVGRGYIHHPRMTADRFLPDPFRSEKGARLFRTGDLGRYRSDGTLEFLGRADNQVKLRGFRIELEEIEANVKRIEFVQNAAVTVQPDHNGEKQLVAYVVLKEKQKEVASSQLQKELEKILPKYMIPACFVQLEALPLSPNGKIDRKSLPAPQFRDVSKTVPPTTKTEKELAAIWSEILGVSQIGKTDHFFDIGGHSLLGIQVVARARKTFNVPLPVSCIFEAPTLESMADAIDTIKWIAGDDDPGEA